MKERGEARVPVLPWAAGDMPFSETETLRAGAGFWGKMLSLGLNLWHLVLKKYLEGCISSLPCSNLNVKELVVFVW